MTSFITHQREDFYLSIHPIENDHPAPPTLLSHVDPDPYNNCKTGAIIDFFPSHKDICGLSSYMKPTNNVDTNTNHCKVSIKQYFITYIILLILIHRLIVRQYKLQVVHHRQCLAFCHLLQSLLKMKTDFLVIIICLY